MRFKMAKNNTTTDLGIARREFLRTTSAAGFALAGTGTATASSDSLGRTHYTEAKFEFQVESPSENEEDLPVIDVDEAVGRAIDNEEGKLYLLEQGSQTSVETFRHSDQVIKSEEYRPLSTNLHNSRAVRQVPLNLGQNYRTLRALKLSEDYRLPSVSLSLDGETLSANVSGTKTSVAPGEESQSSLSPVQLPVELVSHSEELVDNQSIPEYQRARKREAQSTTVRATPTLKIRNYGQLDVVDFTHSRFVDV